MASPRRIWLVRALFGWVLALAALGWAGVAGAQDLVRAQKLFDAGDKLEQSGDCPGAIAKFEAAIEIVETPQMRLRAGRCYDKLDKPLAALQSYERAVVLARSDAELLALAQGQVASVSPRVPRIVVKMPSPAVEGALVLIDGKPVSDITLPQKVEVGSHAVAVSAPGYALFKKEVALASGGSVDVVVVMTKDGDAKPPPPQARSRGAAPWVMFGAAAASLGISIGLGYASHAAFDDLGSLAEAAGCEPSTPSVQCPASYETDGPPAELEVAYDELRGKTTEQNALLGASITAAVLAAGFTGLGVGLYLSGGSDAEPPAATAAPWFTDDGAGFVVVGAF